MDTTSEPASAGSVTRTPRVAPIASALRSVSGAFGGAIARRVTSPPSAASTSLSAASSAYSSLPLTTAGWPVAVEPAVRPEPLADPARVRDGLRQDDDAHGAVVPPCRRSAALPSSARAMTSRWICCVPS